MRIIAWFSGGVTSTIACKLAIEEYKNVEIIYIETGSHHPDNKRFISECQGWFGQEIKILQSPYDNVLDVLKRNRFINSAYGAPCTKHLKTRVRQKFESDNSNITHYVWGFEYTPKEIKRAERLQDKYPDYEHLYPLINKKLTKANCLALLDKAGIKKPKMYYLGYPNNNCIGCVKGGMGYWNKIRDDFPEVYKDMAELERKIGRSCLKQYFLDELPENKGNILKEIFPECGLLCSQVSGF